MGQTGLSSTPARAFPTWSRAHNKEGKDPVQQAETACIIGWPLHSDMDKCSSRLNPLPRPLPGRRRASLSHPPTMCSQKWARPGASGGSWEAPTRTLRAAADLSVVGSETRIARRLLGSLGGERGSCGAMQDAEWHSKPHADTAATLLSLKVSASPFLSHLAPPGWHSP